jgi:hypothetical protein
LSDGSPVSVSPVSPPPEALPWDPPYVKRWGRLLPRATPFERVAWAVILVGLVTIFGLAAQLAPDARGVGTHEQIRLFGLGPIPPCGFLAVTGYPCPSCGFTTTFALAAHGHVIAAIANQPFGFLVFLFFAALVPISLVAVVGPISPLRATDHWRWRWILGVAFVLWALGWLYKVRMLTA